MKDTVKVDEPKECPNCKASWIGNPIPKAQQPLFGHHTHFKREIAIYSMEKDMTIAYRCPDCKTLFDRSTMEVLVEVVKG